MLLERDSELGLAEAFLDRVRFQLAMPKQSSYGSGPSGATTT
jgi:hypothetical protein